jgi:hypothetical protein
MRGLALVLIFLLASGCFIPYGDVWFRFEGVVSDPEGRPIPEARIEIFVNGKLAGERSVELTDAEGRYEFFESSCPCDFDFELVAAKEGYESYSLKLSGRKANRLRTHDIVLRPSQ